ncbi:aldo/keto reductase [Sphingomonas psychrotolerans]|uniref:Aldo/keto reductase n=1 Tax=Sphingomonas psychrotolerans TaxID=1327635 RepID=A0ABU3MZL3_9SPHN|nr:aldo/keto reductase [Sphingomonas psychrotolerans]MDT8757421.1 aldo/keto reductase [Sphingomonas psychrotolerans]
MIPTRRLPGRDLALPELGFGTAPLGNLYRSVSDEDAAAALATGFAGGMLYADTAPYYGFGLAEKRLGAALRASGAGAVISTKVGRLLEPVEGPLAAERHGFRSAEPFEPVYDYSYDGVLRSHEASLARLGIDRIDILLVHDIGRLTHGDRHTGRLVELDGGLRALEKLRSEGAITAFGIGVNECEVALELLDRVPLDLILLAGRYTLLEQGAMDALLPRCAETGTGVVIGGPYNSGILAGQGSGAGVRYDYAAAPAPVVERARAIGAVCERHGVALGAAALQFVLAHPAVVSVVPGVANAGEVAETLARYSAPIPAQLWTELKHVGLLRSDAPVEPLEIHTK